MACSRCALLTEQLERLQIQHDAALQDWHLMFTALQRYRAQGIRATVPAGYNEMVRRKLAACEVREGGAQ